MNALLFGGVLSDKENSTIPKRPSIPAPNSEPKVAIPLIRTIPAATYHPNVTLRNCIWQRRPAPKPSNVLANGNAQKGFQAPPRSPIVTALNSINQHT